MEDDDTTSPILITSPSPCSIACSRRAVRHSARGQGRNRRKSRLSAVVAAVGCWAILAQQARAAQTPCLWDHNSGATFDLRGLTKADGFYHIYDGDDPCTVEEEKSYDYYFNVCGNVGGKVPSSCPAAPERGSALQYDKETQKCNVVGEYDPKLDEFMWKLIKETDPSKGVSLKQEAPKHICSNGAQRTFTIDVVCADKLEPIVTYTREPEHCQYHAEMLSVHGCPKECPVTPNGLCDGHGHCAFDPTTNRPHCYCNLGHGGADCAQSLSTSAANGVPEDNFGTQIGLLVTLLLVMLLLVGIVAYMVLQVYSYRKDAAGRYTAFQGELSRLGRDGF